MSSPSHSVKLSKLQGKKEKEENILSSRNISRNASWIRPRQFPLKINSYRINTPQSRDRSGENKLNIGNNVVCLPRTNIVYLTKIIGKKHFEKCMGIGYYYIVIDINNK